MLIKTALFLNLLLTLSHCASSKSDQNSPDESPKYSAFNDNKVLNELQTSHPNSVKGIIGSFGFSASTNAAAFVAFYEGNSYSTGLVQKLSVNHYRIHATIGTYYSKADQQIGFIKKRTSCHMTQNNSAVATALGDIRGSSIVLTNNTSATAIFPRFDLSSNTLPSGGILIEWGCFLNEDLKLIPFELDQWMDVKP